MVPRLTISPAPPAPIILKLIEPASPTDEGGCRTRVPVVPVYVQSTDLVVPVTDIFVDVPQLHMVKAFPVRTNLPVPKASVLVLVFELAKRNVVNV